jgi:hypothetical protein
MSLCRAKVEIEVGMNVDTYICTDIAGHAEDHSTMVWWPAEGEPFTATCGECGQSWPDLAPLLIHKQMSGHSG